VTQPKAYIMGAPTFGREAQEAGVEGTRIIKCELCEQPAFFAPSSLNRPEAAYATFVCLACGLKGFEAAGITEIAALTDAQLQELKQALGAKRP